MLNKGEGQYGKYIVSELHDPNAGSPEFQAMYNKFAKRIIWMDSNVVDGAFQMNTSWYYRPPERDPYMDEHVHDTDEIIGFFGSNPDDPYDLGGLIKVDINGETHTLTRSSMIFVPAGMKHMPLRILRVDRPIFHFSVVVAPEYDGTGYK